MAKVTLFLVSTWCIYTNGLVGETEAGDDGSIFEIELNRREVDGPHPSLRYLRDY